MIGGNSAVENNSFIMFSLVKRNTLANVHDTTYSPRIS
jgi:hypothetical protein